MCPRCRSTEIEVINVRQEQLQDHIGIVYTDEIALHCETCGLTFPSSDELNEEVA